MSVSQVLTVENIANGENLDFFGEGADKEAIQHLANFYIDNALQYFTDNTPISDIYPSISLDATGEEKEKYIYEMQLLTFQLSKAVGPAPTNMEELFSDNARLVMTLDNYCNKGCMHCVAGSTTENPGDAKMTYDQITNIDPRYLKIFKTTEFGRTGDPMLWSSDGDDSSYDIADIVGWLYDEGMNEVTIALGVFKNNDEWYDSVVNKLAAVYGEKGDRKLSTMITYHHYFPDMDETQIASAFNKTIKGCVKFSDNIVISVLGDIMYEKSSPDSLKKTFYGNIRKIFSGLDVGDNTTSPDADELAIRMDGREIELSIPPISNVVYPFGRFEKTLKKDGRYEEYVKKFDEELSEPYVCPDVLEWPGMIIEPDGDINMCGAFEAIAYPHVSVVSNIFKPYEEVETEFLEFHKKEKEWFLANLPEIVFKEKTTCKIKNNCYAS